MRNGAAFASFSLHECVLRNVSRTSGSCLDADDKVQPRQFTVSGGSHAGMGLSCSVARVLLRRGRDG